MKLFRERAAEGRFGLTRSIPEYGEGWDVDVATDGRIDDRWDYLFYEVALADDVEWGGAIVPSRPDG